MTDAIIEIGEITPAERKKKLELLLQQQLANLLPATTVPMISLDLTQIQNLITHHEHDVKNSTIKATSKMIEQERDLTRLDRIRREHLRAYEIQTNFSKRNIALIAHS